MGGSKHGAATVFQSAPDSKKTDEALAHCRVPEASDSKCLGDGTSRGWVLVHVMGYDKNRLGPGLTGGLE